MHGFIVLGYDIPFVSTIHSLRAAGAGALVLPLHPANTSAVPRICLEVSGRMQAGNLDDAGMRRVKQLGVDDVLMGGPSMPWKEATLRALMERLKAFGLTLGNLMIGGFPNVLYGKPGRDQEIEHVRDSIRAAGKAGLPVIDRIDATVSLKDITRRPVAPGRV